MSNPRYDPNLPPGYMLITVRRGGRGYNAFLRPDGTQSGSHTSMDALHRAADLEHQRTKWKQRKCLCCGTKFTSRGFGHRMCDGCRESASEMVAYRVVGVS